jgi:hypothetical protein
MHRNNEVESDNAEEASQDVLVNHGLLGEEEENAKLAVWALSDFLKVWRVSCVWSYSLFRKKGDEG